MKKNMLYIYPFCFLTKGRHRFSIYDSLHKKIHLFDIELFDIAKNQFRESTIEKILSQHNSKDCEVIQSFVNYLIENDLGRFIDDIQNFPPMEEQWDVPFKIKRCIIDIRDVWHGFDAIFSQLSKLLCPKIEIRAFRPLKLEEFKEIVGTFQRYDFRVLFLLIPFDDALTKDKNIKDLADILDNEYRVMINIYGVSENLDNRIKKLKDGSKPLSYCVSTVRKLISGRDACGIINHKNFHEMDIAEIMENKKYNGCLNRVVSIDENGQIKNCPSMSKTYGNIKTDSILDVCEKEDFKKIWCINNSMIDDCKECEFRIICLGCRAYLTNPSDLYSKPLKCNYIP